MALSLPHTLESDNQYLCKVFLKWTYWANLTIKVSKCHTFRKNKAISEQFQSYIAIRQQRIPPVEQDKGFTYLGNDFHFKTNSDKIKAELKNEIRKYVETIDKLPIECFRKMESMQLYVFSKLKWRFSVNHLTETWVSENFNLVPRAILRK